VVELPAMRIEALDAATLTASLERISEFDWVVFTSQNAVRIAWDALRSSGRDARAFANAKVACVGKSTSDALLAHGLAADVVPERFVAEGVLEAMASRSDVKGARVLYLAAEGARDVLPNGLRELGCDVEVVRVYRSVSDGAGGDALRAALNDGTVDVVTFASASAVRGYVEVVGAELARAVPAISIGPVTSDAIRVAGITLAAEATEASVHALVDATRAFIVS
jgi:uroporphyrinogen III methyltransferase/synthase